jgi:hypothetical protein
MQAKISPAATRRDAGVCRQQGSASGQENRDRAQASVQVSNLEEGGRMVFSRGINREHDILEIKRKEKEINPLD